MVETNSIFEIYQGHYQVILDSPSPQFLENIIDASYKYVWCFEHEENGCSWSPYYHTIYSRDSFDFEVLCRNIKMEYLIETKNFLTLLPSIKGSVLIVQTNVIPPYFLDLSRLQGKTRYDILKSSIDYLFEIVLPGTADYTPIVSPDKKFLEEVIERAKELL